MTISELKNKIKAKNKELRELRAKIDNCSNTGELREINEEYTKVLDERTDLEERMLDLQYPNDGLGEGEYRQAGPIGETQILATYGIGTGQVNNSEMRDNTMDKTARDRMEQRAAYLKEGREVKYSMNEMGFEKRSVSTTNIAFQQNVSPEINPKPGTVSSLVDFVNMVPLLGGESYKKNYVKSVSSADYSTEAEGYKESDPVFDNASTGKYWITVYTEVPEGLLRTNPAQFDKAVQDEVYKAIRRKLSKEIVAGTGSANDQLTGILSANADLVAELEMAAIEADSLDTLVLGYGGDENIEGNTILILNKQTLADFNNVRSTDGKKLYKIKLDASGNFGTISSDETFETTFIINSVLPSFTDAVADTDHFMAFGKPAGYELPIFSDVVVERSKDYKFKEGMVAFRAGVYAGGTPAASKVFTKVKKATEA